VQYATQIILNGLALGGLYCLVAVGLTLVFGVMGIMNFAHGELYMLGAYVLFWTYAFYHVPFVVGVLLAGLIVGCVGVLLELTTFRPLRNVPMMGFVASLGISLILQVSVRTASGAWYKSVPTPFSQRVDVLGATIDLNRILIIASGIGLLLLLGLFLYRTKAGLELRASAMDREAAALQGISINKSAMLTMLISAGLAGVAGALVAPITTLDTAMGGTIIMKAFLIVIVGGVGSIRGALLIAFTFGFVESYFGTQIDPQLALPIGMIAMLFLLSFKPSGLFGFATRSNI
jgi:branched-chain amino acid transport system permease protein